MWPFGKGPGKQALGEFAWLAGVALADHRLTPGEVMALTAFGQRRGLRREDIQKVLRDPSRYKPRTPKEEHGKIVLLLNGVSVMMADGKAEQCELDKIVTKAVEMGLPPGIVNKMVADYIKLVKQMIERLRPHVDVRPQPKGPGVDFGSIIDDFLKERTR